MPASKLTPYDQSITDLNEISQQWIAERRLLKSAKKQTIEPADLALLTKRERIIMQAYEPGKNTYLTLARRYGVGVEAIKKRLYRARLKLRNAGRTQEEDKPRMRRPRACQISQVSGLY